MKLDTIALLYEELFGFLNRLTAEWLPGLLARLIFSSVLLMYFWNSAYTKLGSGFPGFVIPDAGAYAQIVPQIAEAASYDVDQIAFIPWTLVVVAGTYAEFLIPCLILLGLFTRAAGLAMIVFLAVMTYVDIQYHQIGAEAIGGFFDRFQDSPVSDQRLLWSFPLIYLVLYGPGKLSVDHIIGRVRGLV